MYTPVAFNHLKQSYKKIQNKRKPHLCMLHDAICSKHNLKG